MKTKNTVKILIDEAAKVCGSKKDLANEMGVAPTVIAMWASGQRKCQPDDQAAMAGIAGLDAMETLARATIEAAEGTKKYEVLVKTLGKVGLATGVTTASTGANAAVFDFIRCIKCLYEKWAGNSKKLFA